MLECTTFLRFGGAVQMLGEVSVIIVVTVERMCLGREEMAS